MKNIILSFKKEECYCDLSAFYDLLYKKIKEDIIPFPEGVYPFDCRKIHITKNIFDEISCFYKKERECDSSEIGSVFLVFGPKPDLETDDYTVIIDN